MTRFWWTDASDVFLAERRLGQVKANQCEGWDVVKWDEGFFEDKKEAFPALVAEIGMPSIFSPGKIILLYGVPDCHALLADELKNIPPCVLLVMVAKLDRTLRLYSMAKEMESAKVDDILSLTNGNATHWLQDRAQALGVFIDESACGVLVDCVGLDANLLTSELRKLSFATETGTISPWLVQQVVYGSGEVNVFEMIRLIAKGDVDGAHAKMRMLVSSGGAESVTGLLMDWARKLAIAEAFGRSSADADSILGAKKRDKGFELRKHSMSLDEFDSGTKPRKAPISMFKDTKAIYNSCQDMYDKPEGWGYHVALQVHGAILRTRKGEEGIRVMDDFLDKVMGPNRKAHENG